MRQSRTEHIIMGPFPHDATCLRCGKTLDIGKPVALTVFCAALAEFGKVHARCVKRERKP